jgi:E3 ubiquitin-protein ligase HECTD2
VNRADAANNKALRIEVLKKVVTQCHEKLRDGVEIHEAFKPLEEYVSEIFGSFEILNNSFYTHPGTTLGINHKEIGEVYRILIQQPTRRPFVKLLVSCNDLLRRPPNFLVSASDLRWLLILWEIPTLSDCLYHNKRLPKRSRLNAPEIKSLSYEIIKRVIGYLANADKDVLSHLASWFQVQPQMWFEGKVQLLNLYITFHMTRIINKYPYYNSQASSSTSPTLSEYSESAKLNPDSSRGRPQRFGSLHLPQNLQSGINTWSDWTKPDSSAELQKIKFRVSQYGNNWHIKSAARLLSVFFVSNKNKVPIYSFYNTLSDYILVKQDFEIWQSTFKRSNPKDPNKMFREILNVGLINSGLGSKVPQFTFCQFPFLLTLGAKISILEYEARRTMERKAEEAFINALDNRRITTVNLVFHIRRSHITNDSLSCIRHSQSDLKKALRIEFVGEPGVDAGGLKKEWFQLLTKKLFSQENGMFFYNDESHLCWFAAMPLERNDEMFYLVGVVLGLAIYNSTILDLKFPLALYKKLLGKKVGLDDYIELFPSTGKGLSQLLNCKENDIPHLAIFFETSFKDFFGKVITKELIPGGSKILVTRDNRHDYVHRWVDFYMNESINPQFVSFYNGFQMVIGGNAISLFSPREIEMIICGNNDAKVDIDSLKSVTKYDGWQSNVIPAECDIVKWFWEWFSKLDSGGQKKFLSFVTGSDRIPATGVSTMSFKITKLPSYGTNAKLPVAHTCFNELCLYDYKTKEELCTKMNISISESEGFGLR